ncbi:MAG TPA: hypothetical protein VHW72_14775, partial [Candidatus Angelobacter sp.]|nr:hypothetical protein [Candidatus Angelobacter sp.]
AHSLAAHSNPTASCKTKIPASNSQLHPPDRTNLQPPRRSSPALAGRLVIARHVTEARKEFDIDIIAYIVHTIHECLLIHHAMLPKN